MSLLLIIAVALVFWVIQKKMNPKHRNRNIIILATVTIFWTFSNIINNKNTHEQVIKAQSVSSTNTDKLQSEKDKKQLISDCKANIDFRKAEYQKLMAAHEYEDAIRVIKVCSEAMSDPILSQWVKDESINSYVKDIKNQKLNPRARVFAIESLMREYPDIGKEFESLSSELLEKADKLDKAKDAKKRKSEGVSIGMTREEAIASSWGKPEHINTTIRASGRHEQWVYGSGNYLYFEDGKLTSIQN